MTISEEEVTAKYPLHWLVWHNRHIELKSILENDESSEEQLECKDPRGRTPLLLAVTIGHIECVKALLDADANVNCEKDSWTAVQEATARGDAALLALVLGRRDAQRGSSRTAGVPELLSKLSLAPDFYVEMKWEFSSWVPLVSRLCPSDTYRVYKRGANVRVDTTLLGFTDNRWERGDRTYVYTAHEAGARFLEVDHLTGTMWSEWHRSQPEPSADRSPPPPRQRHIRHRLRRPIHINYLDTDKISFERNKSGIWGWRQDKVESVSGYECKVFNANNVELVSQTRWEHVPRAARCPPRRPLASSPLAPLLAVAPAAPQEAEPLSRSVTPTPDSDAADESEGDERRSGEGGEWEETGPGDVRWQDYFASDGTDAPDVGRPRETTTKVQKFRGTLWLCEDYPLQLQEQIMPILELMASLSSPHFTKLKDFVQMQLPGGFPVKIEIPLFHVLNARITFLNIFGTESPVAGVDTLREDTRLSCLLDDSCFAVGGGYREEGAPGPGEDDDDELLHFAVRQSLMEPGTQCDQVDVWEALRGARLSPASSPRAPSPADAGSEPPAPPPAPRDADLLRHEQTMLQKAIEESLASARVAGEETSGCLLAPAGPGVGLQGDDSDEDEELRAALALSAAEHEARETELLDEQRALSEALRRSLLRD